MKYDIVIIGAGISGCVTARRLADAGFKILIIEKRGQLGGNCADEFDKHGILIHKYGPHIFHTNYEHVYKYLKKFTEFSNYKHKVLSNHKGKLYPIPINLKTFNKFYHKNFDSEGMKKFLDEKREKIDSIKNSRDVVVSRIGVELYDAFIKHYTKKQWDCYPKDLDKSVLERLPIRFDENDFYFDDKYQGIPVNGFFNMFHKLVESPNITIVFNTNYKNVIANIKFSKIICTAPIDEYFNYKFGKLKYRSLKFIFETYDTEFFQENSVINYPDPDIPYTRISEFKHITGQKHKKTTIAKEIPTWVNEPMYPVPQKETKELYLKYKELADKLNDVYFIGRLGLYKYINIDVACKEALDLGDEIIQGNG